MSKQPQRFNKGDSARTHNLPSGVKSVTVLNNGEEGVIKQVRPHLNSFNYVVEFDRPIAQGVKDNAYYPITSWILHQDNLEEVTEQ